MVPEYEDNQDLQHKHEIKLEKPEECFFILQSYFLELGFPMLPSLKEYENFTFNPPEEHLRKAYEYYRKTLQCIFYQGEQCLSVFFLNFNQI